ncbi:MAG: Panacea domain-containing protein [Terriglobales bacterium]|jgi:uncharacterized phage-associated protein
MEDRRAVFQASSPCIPHYLLWARRNTLITLVIRLENYLQNYANLCYMALRFSEAKATQAAGFFLKLRGGQMHYIKLIKLLYLADREALIRWGLPFTTDRHVSMDHGPVVSGILNLITDDRPKPVWSKYISAPLGEYEVRLLHEAPTDLLSKAEEALMTEIFEKYGHRNRWDLIDNVMHKLPEWRNPSGTAIPISIREILEAEGEEDSDIRAIIKEIYSVAKSEEILSSVG